MSNGSPKIGVPWEHYKIKVFSASHNSSMLTFKSVWRHFCEVQLFINSKVTRLGFMICEAQVWHVFNNKLWIIPLTKKVDFKEGRMIRIWVRSKKERERERHLDMIEGAHEKWRPIETLYLMDRLWEIEGRAKNREKMKGKW